MTLLMPAFTKSASDNGSDMLAKHTSSVYEDLDLRLKAVEQLSPRVRRKKS